ncbi:putative 2-acylglycerol O-acyltransferase [Dioscorea sansibarensis]
MAQSDDQSIKYEEEFIVNQRGTKLFTCKWIPVNKEPTALVFICHGYGMECSISMRGTGTQLAKAGFEVHGMDYEGHGKSSGLQGYIPNFDNLVDDCSNYFISICGPEKKKKKRFLLGESMGGAVAFLLHRKEPYFWDGVILVAPMCKIAEEMKPHPVIVNLLGKLASIIPTWRLTPTQDIIEVAFKNPEFRNEVRNNPYCYQGRPRLKTALELLQVSLDIEKNLNKVSLPFLIVHGEDDKVTDPSTSKLLYESASSKDKTLKLYPGMWHALTSGEPPENINLVFSDIVSWLDGRATSTGNTDLEMKQKSKHDQQFSLSQD